MRELLEYRPCLVFSGQIQFCPTHSIYHYFRDVEGSPNNDCRKQLLALSDLHTQAVLNLSRYDSSSWVEQNSILFSHLVQTWFSGRARAHCLGITPNHCLTVEAQHRACMVQGDMKYLKSHQNKALFQFLSVWCQMNAPRKST